MTDDPELLRRYPHLQSKLPRIPLCELPTRVEERSLEHAGRRHKVWIKRDDGSGTLYGGNKVRKLEYLLARLVARRCRRAATFGTVASHHALATALYAREAGLDTICFLSHQTNTESAAQALNAHLNLKSELVAYRGDYSTRLGILRKRLWHRAAGVIPMGGSSWLGTVGFVNAGLELAAQIAAGELPSPDRIYIAAGTLGSAAGLAIGLSLAGAPCSVRAVRVSPPTIANERALRALMEKTMDMLTRLSARGRFPALDERRVEWHHDYFAPGYARSNAKTDIAMALAADQLGLLLEPTYTGKTFAAVLDDLAAQGARDERVLFWNTYHSAPLPADLVRPAETRDLPAEFSHYLAAR